MHLDASVGFPVSRRRLLMVGAGLALTSVAFPKSTRAFAGPEYRIAAMSGRALLTGDGRPQTDVWAYDGKVPGPVLRIAQGQPVRMIIENWLDQDTTVHWHGIRLPNAMDGVPGLTQPPIKPGESFVYEFAPPDAGTFWYHPHANSLQQLGRGLAGVLIVEEANPVAVDRDVVWMISDWRLKADRQIAGGFGNAMDAGMSGRVGNTVTLNGRVSVEEPVRAGERIRVRLINGALARIMALRIAGHRPIVVALDGQPCEPHEPADGRLILGPAMRVDVVIDMQGEPEQRYSVIDDFYADLAYELTQLAYDRAPAIKSQFAGAPLELPRNPLPEPDVTTAERHELILQGGMMSGGMTGGGMMDGGGGMMGGGMMNGMGGMGSSDSAPTVWSINGASMTGDGHAGMPPLYTLKLGQSCVLAMRNETAWWHPMHFHGHSFRVLSRNGTPVPNRQWNDTVLLPPKENVEVAFVADNPGDWMLHCHVTDHQMAGLMTVLRIV